MDLQRQLDWVEAQGEEWKVWMEVMFWSSSLAIHHQRIGTHRSETFARKERGRGQGEVHELVGRAQRVEVGGVYLVEL